MRREIVVPIPALPRASRGGATRSDKQAILSSRDKPSFSRSEHTVS